MSRRRVSRSAGWFVGFLALFAAASVSAQVDPNKPYETEKAVILRALPYASGPLADSPINKTTPDDVHEGVYTRGGNLVDPGNADNIY